MHHMTLEILLYRLNEIVKENPEALKMPIVTLRDDEGNGYNAVYYAASIQLAKDLEIENTSAIDDMESVVLLN